MTINHAARDFPIVCVGGSAGGLDAYTRLLKNLPDDLGIAIVIVNHVRTFPTQLHEVLPRFTTMPVQLIVDTRWRRYVEPLGILCSWAPLNIC
jgi:chemotaxis response regulator CheB